VHGPFHNLHFLRRQHALLLQCGQSGQQWIQGCAEHRGTRPDGRGGTDSGGGVTGGKLQHPHQELDHDGGAVFPGQVGCFSISDHPVLDEREFVAEGFDLLPQSDLLGGFQVIESTGVDGSKEFGEVVVEVVEDVIGRRALSRVVAVGSPSSILLFYSKMCSTTSCFPNNITKNRIKTGTRQPNQPLPEPLHTHSPSCSRYCLKRVARSWVKAGPEPAKGHPQGLALTPARTAPHCHSREQSKITAPQCQSRVHRNKGCTTSRKAATTYCLVWVDQAGKWRLAGIQFSPLAEGS